MTRWYGDIMVAEDAGQNWIVTVGKGFHPGVEIDKGKEEKQESIQFA